MENKKILIIPKISKFEWDMHRYNLTKEQLIERYKTEQVDIERILSSHKRQEDSLNFLRKLFDENQFVSRDSFNRKIAENASLVIAFGGDNHFQYVSHYIDKTPLLGINSDNVRSDGVLTYFTSEDIEPFLSKLEKDDFEIEEWQRLEAIVNGEKTAMATSEYFVGEREREEMSRYIIEFKGKKEEQKGSGLLIATGAGSTGWYDSACRYLYPNGDLFPRTANFGKFILTEPYKGKFSSYSLLSGILEKGESLIVYSLNDSEGRLSSDSLAHYSFNRGTKAVIKISDNPLNVIKNTKG